MAGGDASPCTTQAITESLMYTNAMKLVTAAGRLIFHVREISKRFLKISGPCSVVDPTRHAIPSNEPGATPSNPKSGNRRNLVGMNASLSEKSVGKSVIGLEPVCSTETQTLDTFELRFFRRALPTLFRVLWALLDLRLGEATTCSPRISQKIDD